MLIQKTGLLAMLASRLYYINLTDRFSCATAQLIAWHPSIKYILSRLVKWLKVHIGQHFYIFSVECRDYKVFHLIIVMETAQRRMPNKSLNAGIRYSQITKISLKHMRKWKERNNVDLCLYVCPFPMLRL